MSAQRDALKLLKDAGYWPKPTEGKKKKHAFFQNEAGQEIHIHLGSIPNRRQLDALKSNIRRNAKC